MWTSKVYEIDFNFPLKTQDKTKVLSSGDLDRYLDRYDSWFNLSSNNLSILALRDVSNSLKIDRT